MAAALLAGGVWLAGVEADQEPPSGATSSFPAHVSAITVDVVVLDASGAPVRGLSRDDFTVFENGRPQTIVGFEARMLESRHPAAEGLAGSPLVGTNVGRGAGRMLVVLIDDLGLTLPIGQQVKRALEGWLRAGP